jgi:hypothetical protein
MLTGEICLRSVLRKTMGYCNYFTDFSGFRHGVDEVFALLGYYAACVGSGLPTCLSQNVGKPLPTCAA